MIKFIIFNPEEDYDDSFPETAITIEEFLLDPPNWQPALEDIFLVFEPLDDSTNMECNPFGVINFIMPQLEEVANQIKNNQFAILRSSGDWKPSFFIFEPKGENTYFSLLGFLPEPFNSYYPLFESPIFTGENINQREELYKYVANNRENLKPNDFYSTSLKKIHNIEFFSALSFRHQFNISALM